ncbi:MAG: hypothetical protein LBL91_06205 [Lachnospiraceae bacterium]|jgi:hypothetical protein|nr:hypothetical protein [Lachnospiraceae bacterium]
MIKAGDYIRTKQGEIAKITNIIGHDEDKDYLTDLGWTVLESEIKKYAKNYFDLLEIGDFVNEKPVYEDPENPGEWMVNIDPEEDEIERILTHEGKCYEIDEKWI